ncbi:uncharacterized protein [Watersipora subatra]|uniref:uncharacterized protein n=1 Tax=Watersipora subatra TaxID=2589382 RepID=UPI00355C6B9A
MGNESSAHKDPYATNDFELVIRLAKELEYLLEKNFQATGNGLGDKIKSAKHEGLPLPRGLTAPMWRLNKERNLLVHDRSYNSIADRGSFIQTYESVRKQLQELIAPPRSRNQTDSGCLIC